MAIAGAVIGAGTAIYSISSAEKQKKDARSQQRDAQRAIDEFNQQELINPYTGLTVSTEQADLDTETNLSRHATSIDALQRGGVRTVMAGLPTLNQQNILLQRSISADLDKQEKERQLLLAQGEDKIQSLRENREMGALAGFGSQLQAARQDYVSGNTNLASGVLGAGSMLSKTNWGNVSKEWKDIFGIKSGGDGADV